LFRKRRHRPVGRDHQVDAEKRADEHSIHPGVTL
jgi:hypothetical protein